MNRRKTFHKLISEINSKNLLKPVNTTISNELLKLDGHVILSYANYDNRFNIEDLHHKTYKTTIKNKNDIIIPYNKEYAFAHIIVKGSNFYFSKRTTPNKEVEEHNISSTIYNGLTTNQIHDIDRNAKLIDAQNVTYIVNTLLGLRGLGLIP